MVSAEAQARMLARIGGALTPEEADVVRRGRNAQAKHATPRNQDAADYRMATGLEALWGWLFVRGSTERMLELMRIASEGEDALWEKPD